MSAFWASCLRAPARRETQCQFGVDPMRSCPNLDVNEDALTATRPLGYRANDGPPSHQDGGWGSAGDEAIDPAAGTKDHGGSVVRRCPARASVRRHCIISQVANGAMHACAFDGQWPDTAAVRDTPPGAAAIYCRISHDPSGERLGVNRQQLDCEQEAKRRGWTVAEVYVDDDISAFDRRKVRPEYQRLLKDISDGVRDGVMTWRLDRLHRQPQELEEFIVICDKHQVALATVTGDIDLSTSHGRLVARTWGAFAAHESEVRGERLRRAARDRAARGLMPPGRIRCYGYDHTGKVVVPAEASVIREGARRLRLGDSLRSIVADFNRRGIPSAMDCQWQAGALRGVLMSPRIAGFSTYHGEAVGRGTWKRILSAKESDRVRAILMDPERRQTNGPLGHYLLRRIITCARCGHFLVMGRSPNGRVSYNCRRAPGNKRCGTISVTAVNVEWLIFERVCQRLEFTRAP